ncbi:MAG TPA: OmpA family protein [Flavobacteriales bacterium]|jgi:outer membrane protein OmpA-like peptidoglycan-associated protein|nr:OmpA family protein [Flavobacteriales bacterium]
MSDPMKRRRKGGMVLALCLFLCTAVPALAQFGNYTTTDKRAIKLYESGSDCMRQQKWSCAESDLKKACEADPKFIEPRITLAELYEMQGKDADAIKWYGEAVTISPRYFGPASLHLAELEFKNAQYDAAERDYKTFLDIETDPVRVARAKLGLMKCAFAREAVLHPVPFDPKNLGPNVNSKAPEYYPCVTADDGTLMFTRLIEDPAAAYGKQEDFFVTHRQADRAWDLAQPIPSVDTHDNEGAGTLSPDGRFIVFTKCAGIDGTYGQGVKGLGSCDLFISRRLGDRWTRPENLGPPVNSRNWESQPSLGSDGRTLYYVRGTQAQDGLKSMDIYVTSMGEDGAFTAPEKLGQNINTPFQEESVQIHPDGRTLYFSSDGHPGMGGLDIFVSRMQADGTWAKPENLGYPINTGADENSVLVGANGQVAYFASDRPGGQGDLDLYQFELPEAARAAMVNYIHGKVTDKTTGQPVEADVELYDLADGTLATAAYSDPKTGDFLVCLPVGRDYALNASADGYLFFSQNYSIAKGTVDKPYMLDVPLSPITAGSVITLRNIFFETASFALLPASNTELDKLVQLMQHNAAVKVEVGGHTDNVGADAANQKLSEQRANAVRDYVIAKGIDAARITAKGYGETKPTATNDTEEGRAQNRRTEITVL